MSESQADPMPAAPAAMPCDTPDAARPLRGIRILAIEQYGAGPFATLVLADLGAEVIKIELPEQGDVGRTIPPWVDGDDSLFFQSLNRGKRSVAIDLKQPRGRDLFERLVAKSDAVFANMRGLAPAKLRITYADLKEFNPAIVCAFLTGFGRTGPRADEPGYDYIVQAMSGMASLGGEPGGPPTRAGVSVVDFSAGLAAAVALLAGVHRARATGVGGDLDTSLLLTALNLTNYLSSWVLTRGFEPERLPRGAHPSVVPSQLFETSDGWVMVMSQTDAFFRELARRMDMPQLVGDPRFQTMAGRFEHRVPLLATLEHRFREHTVAHWLARLQGAVPIAPVNDLPTALREPQVLQTKMLVSFEHAAFGTVHQVAGPVRPSALPPAPTPAPALGADTWSVLHQLAKVDKQEFQELVAAHVIRQAPTEAPDPAPAGAEANGAAGTSPAATHPTGQRADTHPQDPDAPATDDTRPPKEARKS